MRALVDVIDEVIHYEPFRRLGLAIFVLPSFTLANVYDSTPLSLNRGTHGNMLECIHVDLDVTIFNSFGAYNHMDVEV